MRLFLSGGGSKAFGLDKKFVEVIDKSKPMLYIPIAIDAQKHPYPECLEWIRRYFSEFKFSNIEMMTNLRDVSQKSLEKFGSVYIGGGNTPYLLKELKESGFYEHLNYLIKRDIPVAGGSAGAMILAKTIIPSLSADENMVGLKNFDALNKLQEYDVWCHYEPKMDKEINEYARKYALKKVIALPESCGIYVENKKMTIFGKPSAWIFSSDGKREVKTGEEFR